MAEENLSVADSSEDGDEASGTTWDAKTGSYGAHEYFRVGDQNGTVFHEGAVRFQVPNIGQAESITSATLTVRCSGVRERGSGNLTVRVHGNDVDDCGVLSSSVRPSSGWTNTTASDDATFDAETAADITWDVQGIVQEIVNRGSWAADNHMGLAFRHVSASYLAARMVDYDTDTLADIATLDIVYGVGGIITNRTLTDTIVVSDPTDKAERIRNRETTDALSVTDNSLSFAARLKLLSDAIDVTDSIAVRRERYRIISDAIALVDAIDAQYIPESGIVINNVTLSDSIVLTDFIFELRERSRVQSETLSVLDAIGAERFRDRVITDTVTSVVDSFVSYRARLKISVDSIAVTDGLVQLRERNVTITDIISVADALLELRERYRVLSDDISVIDAIIALFITEVLNPVITASIEVRDIEIGVERLHIVHRVELLDVDTGIKDESG